MCFKKLKRSDRYNYKNEDQRSPFQRDRDRIIYSSHFQRLSYVTQVVSDHEFYIFHNRLTHTLKVAQIARRITENIIKNKINSNNEKQISEIIEKAGGLNPDVVEAGALAHDLGHPPFGHIAEEVLDELLRENGLQDGFEGNAQSFRIICNLAIHRPIYPGLNLTRASLNATLKYPWLKYEKKKDEYRYRKFGAYNTEKEIFSWARETLQNKNTKTLEASIMDISDDIAYSVHDMEDFYKAGLIPLARLVLEAKNFSINNTETLEIDKFLNNTYKRWHKLNKKEKNFDRVEVKKLLISTLLFYFKEIENYDGTEITQGTLKWATSSLIGRYVKHIEINTEYEESELPIKIDESILMEITLLKELTWNYIIENQTIKTNHEGQKQIIRTLFDVFNYSSISSTEMKIFPNYYQKILLENDEKYGQKHKKDKLLNEWSKHREIRLRAIADLISGLSESQAIKLYKSFKGLSFSSTLDSIY